MLSLLFTEYIMSENRAVKGGDRKSIKYIGSKNGSFLTDFFPPKKWKKCTFIGKRGDSITESNRQERRRIKDATRPTKGND